jgi:hypothetical protein
MYTAAAERLTLCSPLTLAGCARNTEGVEDVFFSGGCGKAKWRVGYGRIAESGQVMYGAGVVAK